MKLQECRNIYRCLNITPKKKDTFAEDQLKENAAQKGVDLTLRRKK